VRNKILKYFCLGRLVPKEHIYPVSEIAVHMLLEQSSALVACLILVE